MYQLNAQEEDNIEEADSVENKCQKETGVSDESIKKANNLEPVDDPLVKENAFCVLKKYEVMDENGDINQDNLTKILEPEFGKDKAKTVAENCAIKQDTPQNTANATFWCIGEKRFPEKAN